MTLRGASRVKSTDHLVLGDLMKHRTLDALATQTSTHIQIGWRAVEDGCCDVTDSPDDRATLGVGENEVHHFVSVIQ